MKRKGLILAGGMMLLLAVGCSDKKEEDLSSPMVENIPVTAQTQEDAGGADQPLEDNVQDAADQPLGDDVQDAADGETGNESGTGSDSSANESAAGAAAAQETAKLLGDVVSVGDNSAVISQAFEEEDEGATVMWAPAEGSEDEVLVNVIFTADTQYEYKTVKNSGINPEDIEVRAGSFSDIKEELSLDMTGSYQGNDFYAVKVSISEFIR